MRSLTRTLPHPGRTARPAHLLRWIDAVFATYRHRRRLAELPEDLRQDVGLSDDEVRGELERPFWDVPDWWR